MGAMTDAIMVALLLINLGLSGCSRLGLCISLVAVQGCALAVLPLVGAHGPGVRSVCLAALLVLFKGIVFPRLLRHAVRDVHVRREVEPFVGYGLSLLIGLLLLLVAFCVGDRLPLPLTFHASSLILPGAIGTILTGLFLLISRKKAVTQVVGYLVMENGIAAFGLATVSEIPLLVELGMLLDAFVGVFVMGIVIWHISREFDHIDADRLNALKG